MGPLEDIADRCRFQSRLLQKPIVIEGGTSWPHSTAGRTYLQAAEEIERLRAQLQTEREAWESERTKLLAKIETAKVEYLKLRRSMSTNTERSTAGAS